jgi:hypothetical protein
VVVVVEAAVTLLETARRCNIVCVCVWLTSSEDASELAFVVIFYKLCLSNSSFSGFSSKSFDLNHLCICLEVIISSCSRKFGPNFIFGKFQQELSFQHK